MQLRSLATFFKTWYPSIIMMIIIFMFSSAKAVDSDVQSGLIVNALELLFPDLQGVDFLVNIVRKTAHFSEYMLLGILTARALKLTNKNIWIALPICIIYATSDEIHQYFVPGRSMQFTDVLIDSAGSAFGIILYWFFTRNKK